MRKYLEFLKESYKETMVISGFPGIGKSYFFRKNWDKLVLDSDSTNFSWTKTRGEWLRDGKKKGIRHPDFPNNYIKHIKENLGKSDIILVSSHKVVRDALVENNIPFTLVYPSREIKEEYLQRYKDRGSDEGFVDMLDKNWDKFLDEIENQEGCDKIEIEEGKYLSDYL